MKSVLHVINTLNRMFLSASSLNQESTGRYVASLGHIISTLNQESTGRYVASLGHIISTLNQESTGRYVASLGHIISTPNQPVFDVACLIGVKQQAVIHSHHH